MFQDTTVNVTDDIDAFAESAVHLFVKQQTLLYLKLQLTHNQKPWITRTMWGALKTNTAAYNLGLVKEGEKWGCGKRVELLFQEGNPRSMW